METAWGIGLRHLGCVALALVLPAAHAEVYKWVDAAGRTHYADHPEAVGRAKSVELKQAAQPASSQASGDGSAYWQDKERQFRERQVLKRQGEASSRRTGTQHSLSRGRVDDGSDAARCNLAKDILSGEVVHRNGTPTDAYDRQVAENDVRAFCR